MHTSLKGCGGEDHLNGSKFETKGRQSYIVYELVSLYKMNVPEILCYAV